MTIEFVRPEVSKATPDWEKIRDITEGQNLSRYLRQLKRPNGLIDTVRQEAYEDGAVFYSVSGHTHRGMVGTVFSKDANLDVPPGLEYLRENADGRGNSLIQQSQSLTGDVIRYGRAGLWVDFPTTEGEVSRADRGRFFATVHTFQPDQIINWRTQTTGAVTRLSLVVIAEYEERIEGYEVEKVKVLRELALDEEGRYFVRKWEKQGDEDEFMPGEALFPTDSAGSPLTQIPFTFVGSENNDPTIDPAPMLDIVRVNVGHFRNSADYEDSVFYAGQVQPYMTGADASVYELMQEQDFYIGSRMLMPVPSGEAFGFAEPGANPLVRQAMIDKVDQMIGLGARFVQSAGAGKTDTEARSDSLAKNSTLSLVAKNVGDAYTAALGWVGLFMGEATEGAFLELNQDFAELAATPAALAAWVKSYIDGAVPQSQYIQWMKRNGYFDPELPDEEIERELDEVATP